jgi:hypothetical protein
MDIKEKMISYALSAVLAVGASALTAWKQQAVAATKIEQMQQQLADHQEDIKRIYHIDGKLEQVIIELRNLREDIRKNK